MRNLELSQETAKRWYEGTDEELKALALQTYPELCRNSLPKSWEELEAFRGYYVTSDSQIRYTNDYDANDHTRETYKDVFATKEQVKASIALAKLSQLRRVYRDGWVPDWSDNREKYCILIIEDMIMTEQFKKTNHFLSFQDAATRDLFLKNFRDLIEKAKPLMS